MIDKLRNLTSRAEFFIVVVVSFAYAIGASGVVLVLGIHRIELSTFRVLRGILIEALLLAFVIAFLRLRGWRIRRFGFDFSFSNLLAGVGLFVCYILAYWLTAIAVVSVFPDTLRTQTFHFVRTAPGSIMLVFILLNSLFEEFIVTGYVVNALASQGAALSITASALLRFVYHLYQGPIASVTILPLGLLFASVYWRWRNLWP